MIVEIGAGFLLANFADWSIHKYVLHGLGKKKESFFNYHWHDHHNVCRRKNNFDVDNYKRSVFKDNPHAREFWSLGLGAGSLAGLLALAGLPVMASTIIAYALVYYALHAYSHSIAPDLLPWHKDHHMGRNQDANWCVVVPVMDWIMDTRIK